MSLLEQAKSRKHKLTSTKKQFTDEEIELALSYVKGDIEGYQVSDVMGFGGKRSVMIYSFIARALRQHFSK